MRIAFFGLPLGALLLLEDGNTIDLAVLSPVDGPGRRRLTRRLGPARVLEVRETSAAGAEVDVRQRLAAEPPDLIVSWFWTRRLAAEVLRSARLGGIGVHPSLLPRHRGPDPFFWAIDAGDEVTGVTVHRLTDEYDAGSILLQEELAIRGRDAWQLARALDRPSLRCLRHVVDGFARGEAPADRPQDASRVSLAPRPTGDLLRLDFTWTTARAWRRVRALGPNPGVALSVRGVDLFATRWRPAEAPPLPLVPGEAVVWPSPEPRVLLRFVDGCLAVEQATLAGSLQAVTGADLAARVAASG